jgi:hypothetical protein
MTDDLDRQLRERLPAIDLPEAPASLQAVVERIELGQERERTGGRGGGRRGALWLLPTLAAALAVVVVSALVGGWNTNRPGASPSASDSAGSSGTTAVVPSSSAGPTGTVDPAHLVATDNGLILTVDLDRAEVAPGGTVTATATVRNERSTPVILGFDQCGSPVTMSGSVKTPTDPVGRTWDGIAGAFKTFALTSGTGLGGGPASEDRVIPARRTPVACTEGSMERSLAAGTSETVELAWTAQIVEGVPALPGDLPLVLYAVHDPEAPPTAQPRSSGLRVGLRFQTWQQLEVRTTIRIVGDAPPILSLGEAVDAMLGSRHFMSWLTLQPERTWSGTNVFLQNYGQVGSIVPAGPSWEVDLFREVGVPRNWAIGFVDPTSGKILHLEFCNNPCQR